MTLDAAALQSVYGGTARAFAAASATVYERMAAPLVVECPLPLDTAAVLDFGAGTGATTRAVAAAGARVVAADLTFDMLEQDRARRPPAVNADVLGLPFRARTFDVALGAFVISHVGEPARALREVARTVRDDGAVLTVGYDARWSFPAKQVIHDVLVGLGMTTPAWYEALKHDIEPLTAFPDRLAAVAVDAGLADVVVHEHAVDVDARDADAIITWRLGTPIYAPFMATRSAEQRDEIVAALRNALGPHPDPLVPELLVLVGRVGGDGDR